MNEQNNQAKVQPKLFDYRALRLLIGFIAFSLPLAVCIFTVEELSSISASYYTSSRDAFVGMLTIVGALMFAYKGNPIAEKPKIRLSEAQASKIASITALLVAFFPTEPGENETFITPIVPYSDLTPIIHYIAAGILFSILAYFCLFVFRKDIKDKGGKKSLRSKIYFACGWGIVISIVTLVVCRFIFKIEVTPVIGLPITLVGEWIALWLFGTAWIISGKWNRLIADKDEILRLLPESLSRSG